MAAEINDRERAILIVDLCRRLGQMADAHQPISSYMMDAIRKDAARLSELFDARELSMYRQRYGSPPQSGEEG